MNFALPFGQLIRLFSEENDRWFPPFNIVENNHGKHRRHGFFLTVYSPESVCSVDKKGGMEAQIPLLFLDRGSKTVSIEFSPYGKYVKIGLF